MKRKIGEIFEHNGEWYRAVKSQGKCCSCDLSVDDHCVSDFSLNGSCFSHHRKDKQEIIFKKLEKVGEPLKIHNRLVLRVKADAYKCMNCCFYSKGKCELTMQECEHYDCGEENKFIEIKQNKEDMEEKEQKWGVSSDTINEINKGIEPMNTSRNIDTERSGAEGIRRNLKPFNLEAARSGKPVCTRDGRNVRIIAFDAKRKDKKNIIALVPSKDYPGFEDLIAYHNNGNYYGEHENDGDLMMLPEKKEGWVNVYKDSIYDSEDGALMCRAEREDLIGTIKIEWEE